MGRVRECRCVVDDDTGRGVELGLDCVERAGIESGFVKSALRERKPLAVLVPLPLLDATATLFPLLANFSATEAPILGPAPRMSTTGLAAIVLL
jgi:hypothetical protein